MNWLWSEVTHLVLTAPQCTENERLNTLISPSVKYSTALLSPWVARSDVGCNLNSNHFILNKCTGLNQTVQSHTQSYDPIKACYLVCHIERNHYVQIHSAEVNANQVHHTVQKQLVCPMQTAWQAYAVVLPSPRYALRPWIHSWEVLMGLEVTFTLVYMREESLLQQHFQGTSRIFLKSASISLYTVTL